MSAILTVIWANKELIGKTLAGILVAFFLWWFFWHNPKVIKSLETEKVELSRQIVLRDNAINLLGEIRAEHERITNENNQNIQRIRNGRKPGNRGVFISDGMLADVYADSATP